MMLRIMSDSAGKRICEPGDISEKSAQTMAQIKKKEYESKV